MARQFQPPTYLAEQKTKEEALAEPIGKAIGTIPEQYAAYKIRRRQQKLDDLEMQMKEREFKSKYGTGVAENIQPGRVTSVMPGGPEEDVFGFEATPPTFTEETTEQRVRRMGTEPFGAETNRIKAERETGTGKTKPPTGFRFTGDGDLEAIPGGPADIKLNESTIKKENLKRSAVSQADRIIGKVEQALAKVGGTSSGILGRMRIIPGTKAKDLASDIQTIKANLGFAELQAMRQASPTGGALGQIAVQELESLQATLASLDQDQSPQQLRNRLGEIKTHYQKWKSAIEQSDEMGEQPEGASSTDDNDPLGIR